MTELIAVVTITLLAVISPGPDFAMVSRNSLLLSRRAGVLTACGIGGGVLIHVSYTLIGVGVLIQQSLWLFTVLKAIGAAYLIYLGVSMLRNAGASAAASSTTPAAVSDFAALKTGFLTNVLNPKTTIFIVSLFMQVVNPQTPLGVQIGYGLFIALAHILWFSAVALLFSAPGINARLLRLRKGIDRAFGGLLITFGALLAIAGIK
ncbi:Threonine efflux protein [Serratia quinivorans]|jgi:RhtB (resistance to homoserine/threonine) family protein|uniref:Threonine efflux protein n=2 Tax=Serratia TaxID=613 RepID=A0A379YFS9_9GAMM|nr:MULTISPECIES: LysE family transporter [Serratia]MCS4264828.1 RhtB (resistance to homoserine/threonine) family protein [Serratia sp. BIGb0163]RYM66239.1 amino acid transporter [Serratia proteamaculans]CAI0833882.1 Threonine efflux protein [Serratia quinivorans]CAI1511249.1 Threonine efflux protein [Serratia quinivorans]CAI1572846.1 Threonine efflux protein [Serratia quinivorans]